MMFFPRYKNNRGGWWAALADSQDDDRQKLPFICQYKGELQVN